MESTKSVVDKTDSDHCGVVNLVVEGTSSSTYRYSVSSLTMTLSLRTSRGAPKSLPSLVGKTGPQSLCVVPSGTSLDTLHLTTVSPICHPYSIVILRTVTAQGSVTRLPGRIVSRNINVSFVRNLSPSGPKGMVQIMNRNTGQSNEETWSHYDFLYTRLQ